MREDHELICLAVPLVWGGDDIGLDSSRDAMVTLRDPVAPTQRFWHVSLKTALSVADRIDPHGMFRMAVALNHAAEHGYLSEDDMGTWLQYIGRQPRSEGIAAQVQMA